MNSAPYWNQHPVLFRPAVNVHITLSHCTCKQSRKVIHSAHTRLWKKDPHSIWQLCTHWTWNSWDLTFLQPESRSIPTCRKHFSGLFLNSWANRTHPVFCSLCTPTISEISQYFNAESMLSFVTVHGFRWQAQRREQHRATRLTVRAWSFSLTL